MKTKLKPAFNIGTKGIVLLTPKILTVKDYLLLPSTLN